VSASCKILNEDPSPANLSDGSACAFVQANVHSERQALDAAPATGHALTHDDSVDIGHTIDEMCRRYERNGGGGGEAEYDNRGDLPKEEGLVVGEKPHR
jgi:hypothetical protein